MSSNANVTPLVTSQQLQSCPSTSSETNSLSQYTDNLITNYGNSLTQTMQALNIPVCSYTTSQTASTGPDASASLSYWYPGWNASLGKSQSETDETTAIGCESITVQSALNAQINETLNCVLTQISEFSDAYTQQTNDIQVNVENVDTGNITITVLQSNNTQGTVVNFANSEIQATLQFATNAAATSVANSLSNITTTGMADPQGQLTFEDSLQSLNTLISNNMISQIVDQALSNTIETNTANETVTGVNCTNVTLSSVQSNYNDYVVSQIANSVINEVNNSTVMSALSSYQASMQEQTNTGEWMLPSLNKTWSIVIWIIIVIVVIVIVVFLIRFICKSSKSISSVPAINITAPSPSASSASPPASQH